MALGKMCFNRILTFVKPKLCALSTKSVFLSLSTSALKYFATLGHALTPMIKLNQNKLGVNKAEKAMTRKNKGNASIISINRLKVKSTGKKVSAPCFSLRFNQLFKTINSNTNTKL